MTHSPLHPSFISELLIQMLAQIDWLEGPESTKDATLKVLKTVSTIVETIEEEGREIADT